MQQIKELVDQSSIEDDSDQEFELALTSRLSRQKEHLRRVTCYHATISSDSGLNATILRKTLEWDIEEISIEDKIFMGEEGWSWFAKGLQRNRNRVEKINASKQIIAEAKRDDLRTAWDATNEFGCWEIIELQFEETVVMDILDRDCSGSCADTTELEAEVCRYTDKRDEDGKIVDCGWQRLEEIWDAGQK